MIDSYLIFKIYKNINRDLSYNKITGTIPESLNNIENLETLYVDYVKVLYIIVIYIYYSIIIEIFFLN